MAYIQCHPVRQLEFQINRILTYGDDACNLDEVMRIIPSIVDLDTWYHAWRNLGETAEKEERSLHAAYYYRLAEFFLKEGLQKDLMYQKSIENFHQIIGSDKDMRVEYVPYKNIAMKTFVFPCKNPIGNLVIFGGYDSFIEEFYLTVKEFFLLGYTVYLFEGPGQGETLKKGLTFEPDWEKPTGAVLDYFGLHDVCVVGISWGGYFALRSAAFDSRITKVVAYDVLYDGFDCMTNPFPSTIKPIIKLLFQAKCKKIINLLIGNFIRKSLMIDWVVSHGQYITGTKNPYDFYIHLKQHTLSGILQDISCDTLLLAGENDHYIPKSHYSILMNGITNARSLTGKMFTEAEGGAQHCQIGHHKLATDYIAKWIMDCDR